MVIGIWEQAEPQAGGGGGYIIGVIKSNLTYLDILFLIKFHCGFFSKQCFPHLEINPRVYALPAAKFDYQEHSTVYLVVMFSKSLC